MSHGARLPWRSPTLNSFLSRKSSFSGKPNPLFCPQSHEGPRTTTKGDEQNTWLILRRESTDRWRLNHQHQGNQPTYDQVRRVLPMTFVSLGVQQVKNIQ